MKAGVIGAAALAAGGAAYFGYERAKEPVKAALIGGGALTPSRVFRTKPVSTLPGPVSTKRVAPPRAAHAARRSSARPRDRLDELGRDVGEGRCGRAASTGRRAAPIATVSTTARKRDGGSHQRRVEGAGHGQPLGAHAALTQRGSPASSAASEPESTSWSGALSLAIVSPTRRRPPRSAPARGRARPSSSRRRSPPRPPA